MKLFSKITPNKIMAGGAAISATGTGLSALGMSAVLHSSGSAILTIGGSYTAGTLAGPAAVAVFAGALPIAAFGGGALVLAAGTYKLAKHIKSRQ